MYTVLEVKSSTFKEVYINGLFIISLTRYSVVIIGYGLITCGREFEGSVFGFDHSSSVFGQFSSTHTLLRKTIPIVMSSN